MSLGRSFLKYFSLDQKFHSICNRVVWPDNSTGHILLIHVSVIYWTGATYMSVTSPPPVLPLYCGFIIARKATAGRNSIGGVLLPPHPHPRRRTSTSISSHGSLEGRMCKCRKFTITTIYYCHSTKVVVVSVHSGLVHNNTTQRNSERARYIKGRVEGNDGKFTSN